MLLYSKETSTVMYYNMQAPYSKDQYCKQT